MKETLVAAVQGQMGRLDQADTEELGQVIDMIKDLEEAMYYCAITKAMEENEKEPKYFTYPVPYYRDMDRDNGRMYYTEGSNSGRGGMGNSGRDGGMNSSSRNDSYGGRRNYGSRYEEGIYPIDIRDYREGRSPLRRKNYMESKELHKTKEVQMQELEEYLQDLGHDVMEMISDATPEEKKMLQKRMTELAGKIV